MKTIGINDGDHVIIHDLTAYDGSVGRHTAEAAEGMPAVGFFAATPDGAAIHADLQVNLSDTGPVGRVWGVITGVAKVARLGPFKNKTIYEIVTVPGTTYRRYTPYYVEGSTLVGGVVP